VSADRATALRSLPSVDQLLRRLADQAETQGLTRARLTSLTGRIPRQGALCLQLPVRQSGIPMVEPLMIRAANRSGLAVHVWTIDDGAEMERLLDLGVDGIMTDTLDTLRGILRRRGAWHEDGAAP